MQIFKYTKSNSKVTLFEVKVMVVYLKICTMFNVVEFCFLEDPHP